MTRSFSIGFLCTVIAFTLTSTALSETHVAEELAQLKREVAQLRQAQEDNWLSERRSEEIKALVREVLSDADIRESLQPKGITAGHDGKHFFLASADDGFKLTIGGQMQFRFIANSREDSGSDDFESGFQLRRTKIAIGGHIMNPKIGYKIVLAAERSGGDVLLEDFALSYKLTDNLKIAFGQMKLPFLREELLSSSRQLAVDRSSVTEYFTLDRGQGVQLAYSADTFKTAFMISDGADSEGEDFNDDKTDIALTARVDVKLLGDWKRMKDFVAWRGDDSGAFLGAAVHYQVGETGSTASNDNFLVWTVDGLYKVEGFSIMAAINGLSTDNQSGDDFDDLGVLVQAAYMITDQLQPYVRYDFLDIDGADEINMITAGANYYFKKHNAKFTADIVYGLDPLVSAPSRRINDPFSDGLGLLKDASGEDGQIAFRTQFQLLF